MPAFSAIKNGLKEIGAKFTSGRQNAKRLISDIDDIESSNTIESASEEALSGDQLSRFESIDDILKNPPKYTGPDNYWDDTEWNDIEKVVTNTNKRSEPRLENIMKNNTEYTGPENYWNDTNEILNTTSYTNGKQTEDIPIYDGGRTFTNSAGKTINIGGAKRYAFRRQRNRVNDLEEQINNVGENTDTSALEQSLEQERQKFEIMQQDPTQIRTRSADFIMGNPKLVTGAVGATVTGGLVLELARSNGSLSNEQLYGQAPLQNDYY